MHRKRTAYLRCARPATGTMSTARTTVLSAFTNEVYTRTARTPSRTVSSEHGLSTRVDGARGEPGYG